jgi:hypothetical protein
MVIGVVEKGRGRVSGGSQAYFLSYLKSPKNTYISFTKNHPRELAKAGKDQQALEKIRQYLQCSFPNDV